MRFKGFALAAAAGFGAVLVAQQAVAQAAAQAQAPQLSREERLAIAPLFEAVQRQDWAAASAASAAAQAAARTPFARYAVAELQFELARATQNESGQSAAIDAMLASGAAPADQMRPLLGAQAAMALRYNDALKAERALTRLVELSPNDPEALLQLAEVKLLANKRGEAVPLYQRALAAATQNGARPPERLFRRLAALAFDARMQNEAMAAVSGLLRAYPSPVNWRDALLVYQDLAQGDASLMLDIGRLMRAANAFGGERDMLEFATALNQAGHPGEAKAVLDEGIAQNMLETSKASVAQVQRTINPRATQERGTLARVRSQGQAGDGRAARAAADTLFGHGQYAEAAELYRAALEKGGEDPNLVNSRLGAALALAGRRADSEAALARVSGNRAGLAALWMAWLAARPA